MPKGYLRSGDWPRAFKIVAMTHTPGRPASQWDGLPLWLAPAALGLAGILVLGYLYAIPLIASIGAARMPAAITDRLGAEVLAALDRQVFTPSEIPRARQQALETAFRKLAFPEATRQPYTLVFRKSDAIGANAMALPSGTIVVTDGLVTLAEDDREILGVLAHEAGHVDHRHGLRSVLQNSFVGLVLAWLVGDISSLAAAAPAALLEASYSRELEREADVYAIAVLRASGVPLQHLANILRRLESSSGGASALTLRYLSTHPATSERLARLEGR